MPRSALSVDSSVEVVQLTLREQWHWRAIVSELDALHDQGVIRLIDALVVTSDSDSGIAVHAHTRLTARDALRFQRLAGREPRDRLRHNLAASPRFHWEGSSALLTAADALSLSAGLRPGEAAVAVVFEHSWARRLASLLQARGAAVVVDCVLREGEVDALAAATAS